MMGNLRTPAERDALLETFVAELTLAAYRVALRHGTGGTWVDLQLDLWRVLAETVKQWGWQWPQAGGPAASAVWRECFTAELTEAACRTTLRHGAQGLLLEVNLDLDQAFRSVIGGYLDEPMVCRTLSASAEGRPGAVPARDQSHRAAR